MSSLHDSRRDFLAACGASASVALAGCSGTLLSDDGTRIVSRSFERVDREGDDRIRVTFDAADEEVRVTGFAYYGSSSCDELVLKSADYDRESDALRVEIGSEGKLFALACTGDMAATDYRVTVRFAGGLPGTVEVAEYLDGERQEQKVVEREN